MNDEAVVEVVAVLLLYHVQLLESQVDIQDGLSRVGNDLSELELEIAGNLVECVNKRMSLMSVKILLPAFRRRPLNQGGDGALQIPKGALTENG